MSDAHAGNRSSAQRAGEILAGIREGLDAGTLTPDPGIVAAVRGIVDLEDVSKSYALVTQPLCKVLQPTTDVRALSSSAWGRLSPRALCKAAVVPFNDDLGRPLALSKDPYVSNPLRGGLLGSPEWSGSRSESDAASWVPIVNLLNDVESDSDPEAAAMALLTGVVAFLLTLTVTPSSLIEQLLVIQQRIGNGEDEYEQRGALLVDRGTQIVRAQLGGSTELEVAASNGFGSPAEVPWLRIYDPTRSPTPADGEYIALLFAADGSAAYLTLILGTESASLGAIDERVELLRQDLGPQPSLQPSIDLRSRQTGGRPRSYERATIYAVRYAAGDVPADDEILGDIRRLAALLSTVSELHAAEPGEGDVPASFDTVVQTFGAAVRASGLDYGTGHDQLIGSFLTALTTKPFVILTGLSGSGKTGLALAFGQWLGSESVLVVPVRPDWTSPDLLLGYVDALAAPSTNGKQPWVVPKTLEFMLRAAENSTTPYVLVLDEMNLAHVERYFADVLSGMESGQDVLPDLVQDEGDFVARIEAGGLTELPRNLFIVGTVNVDETTYMFSPKVLDRANTFEFRVQTSDLGNGKPLVDVLPAAAEMAAGVLEAASTTPDGLAEGDTFGADLRSLHELLSTHDREFGHRTYHEAIRFARRFRELGHDPRVALDLQVLQKVLPRLHGSRRELTSVLNDLGGWCYRGPSVDPTGSFDTATTDPDGAALPASYDKLHRMAKRLRDRHFVSFAE